MDTAERTTLRIDFDAETLREAQEKGIPVAEVAQGAVRRAVRERRTPEERETLAVAWAEENAEALARLREWNETHPLPLAEWQVLQVPDAEPIDE